MEKLNVFPQVRTPIKCKGLAYPLPESLPLLPPQAIGNITCPSCEAPAGKLQKDIIPIQASLL